MQEMHFCYCSAGVSWSCNQSRRSFHGQEESRGDSTMAPPYYGEGIKRVLGVGWILPEVCYSRKISKPLHKMLGKEGFKCYAFQQLKKAVSAAPVLALPKVTADFTIETNTLGVVGVVLLQKGIPIAFLSKPLSPRNRQPSIYEREMLAIVIAVQKCRRYLIRRHFKIKTDHQSLKYLMEQRVSIPSQQKWIQS